MRIVFLVMCAFILFAFSGKDACDEKKLIGKWSFVYFKSKYLPADSLRAYLDKLKNIDLKGKTEMVFNADSTFMGSTRNGRYFIDKKQCRLIQLEPGKDTVKSFILRLDKDFFVFSTCKKDCSTYFYRKNK